MIELAKERIPVSAPTVFDFNKISEPGTYVMKKPGGNALLRIPPSALAEGHSPLLNIELSGGCSCVKLAEDPYLPISKARELAANMDIAVDF